MRDPVPWPGIEPRPPALGEQSLIDCTTREVPISYFKVLRSINRRPCRSHGLISMEKFQVPYSLSEWFQRQVEGADHIPHSLKPKYSKRKLIYTTRSQTMWTLLQKHWPAHSFIHSFTDTYSTSPTSQTLDTRDTLMVKHILFPRKPRVQWGRKMGNRKTVRCELRWDRELRSSVAGSWSTDRPHPHHLGTCQKYRSPGPTPHLVNHQVWEWGSGICNLTSPLDDAKHTQVWEAMLQNMQGKASKRNSICKDTLKCQKIAISWK